jgi:hypothetical protein
MDLNQLFDEEGLRNITGAWRDQHLEDDRQYGQIADVVQRRLEQQTIDGDSRFSAGRRARKVAKNLRKMQKASRKAAAAAEALYGCYVNEIVELPARRATALERKETRRQRLGIAASAAQASVAKSLDKSTAALHGTPVGNPQVTPVEQAPRYVSPQPWQYPGQGPSAAQPIPNIGDLFDQEAM